LFFHLGLALPDYVPLIFQRKPTRKQKVKKEIPPGNLYAQALEISKAHSLEELYEKTKLPFSWLRKFRQGSIPTPSVQRVELIIVSFTSEAQP